MRAFKNLFAYQLVAERAGFRLPVARDADHDQVRIVEHGSVGVRERVAELASFVDRAGRFRRNVARDMPGRGELAEELREAVLVARDVRVDLE